MSSIICPACVVVMLVLTAASAQEMPRDQPPICSAKPDVVAFKKMENDRLAAAQRANDPVEAVKSPRTIENTLAPYDEATRQRNAAIYFSTLIQPVYPGAAYRDRDRHDDQSEARSNGAFPKSPGLSGASSTGRRQGRSRDALLRVAAVAGISCGRRGQGSPTSVFRLLAPPTHGWLWTTERRW
jgi:hypothetical protein